MSDRWYTCANCQKRERNRGAFVFLKDHRVLVHWRCKLPYFNNRREQDAIARLSYTLGPPWSEWKMKTVKLSGSVKSWSFDE